MSRLIRHTRNRYEVLYRNIDVTTQQIAVTINGQADIQAAVKRSANFAALMSGQADMQAEVMKSVNYAAVMSGLADMQDAVTVVSDPSGNSLTGWWRGDSTTEYSPTAWAGTASAGSSGSRSLDHATNAPDAGTTVNSHTPANYKRANSDRLTNATAMSTLISASAYFGWVLFKTTTIDTAAALSAAYTNNALMADTGAFWGQHLTTSGGNKVQIYHWDGGAKGVEIAISTGVWNLICFRYDGTNIRAKLNSGSVQTAAAGNITTLTGTLATATPAGGLSFYDGDALEFGIMASAGTDALFDNVKSYVNTRYSLSL